MILNRIPSSSWLAMATVSAALGTLSLLTSCQDSENTAPMAVGTESHFLMQCASDSECGDLECFDGHCSTACDVQQDCSALAADSVCGETHDGRACVLPCEEDRECETFDATCSAAFCAGLTALGAEAGPSSTDSTNSTTPTPTDASASSAAGEPTTPDPVDPTPMSGVDAGTEPSVPSDPGGADAGGEPMSSGNPGPLPDAAASQVDPFTCSVDSDCVLAVQIDVCCPTCEEAFAAAYVAEEACLHASGEAAPDGCMPADCNDGCPGAGCDNALGAVCVAGFCAVAVDTARCGSCELGERCALLRDSGYECVPAECEWDSCHPERCDEIGERCCNTLPGDGANYCNTGLECGPRGCEAPMDVDPERVCGTGICAEGDVCCDKCEGSCVNALSGANCPDDSDPDRVCSNEFECVDSGDYCNATTQYCARTAVGPSPQTLVGDCVPLPDACVDDPTCDCWNAAGQYGTCSEADGGGFFVDTLGE